MDVIIPPQDISGQHLLVLEYQLIWYLRTPKKFLEGLDSHWGCFYWDWIEEVVKRVAKEKYKMEILRYVDEFLLSFDLIRIPREYDVNGNFKEYGDTEYIEALKKACMEKRNCLNCKTRKDINSYLENGS